MGRTAKIAAAVIVMLTLCACVAGSADAGHAASGTLLSQFLLGVWHGLIAPVTLLVPVAQALRARKLAQGVIEGAVAKEETKRARKKRRREREEQGHS